MVTDPGLLPSETRDELLKAVCHSRVAVELHVEGREGAAKFGSRFLKAVMSEEHLYLLVEVPKEAEASALLSAGEELEAMFCVGGARYTFLSVVEGKSVHTAGAGQRTGALVLSYPLEIENLQRRAKFRLTLGEASPVTVAFLDGHMEDGPAGLLCVYSGLVSNIGGGGMAVLCRQRLPDSVGAGAEMVFSLQLPDEPEHLFLKGVIRERRRTDTEDVVALSIEFRRDDDEVRARKSIALIERFIAKHRRESPHKSRPV